MGKPKVMVALRDGASIESLMTLACQLSQAMDAELLALHIVEVPLLTPLEVPDEAIDHVGKGILARATGVAAKLSYPVSAILLRAREAGEAIVGVAAEQGVELLVLGHHKPHPHALAETLLGGVVRYAAHHSPCRVIVQIPAPERK
jgi:nucleotide-binding universal stress UspA family protein